MKHNSIRESDTYQNDLIDNVILLAGYLEDLKIDLDCVADARKQVLNYQLIKINESENKNNSNIASNNEGVDEKSDIGIILSKLIDMEIKLTKSIASQSFNKVTIESLRATRSVDGKNTMMTSTGRYLISLWMVMFLVIGLATYLQYQVVIFAENNPIGDLIDSSSKSNMFIINAINPFLFGTLGACVYLMRVTSKKLHKRTFNPSRIPGHFNRLFLGTVSGGIIILFLKDTVILGSPGNGVPITAAGIGFIAGYSIEFLYQIIDRIITAVIPTISSSFDPGQVEIKKRKILKERYEKDLMKAKSVGSSKEVIELLEQLNKDLT